MKNTTVLEARNPTIDIVRGVAILGTLWTNIWLFTSEHGLYGALMLDSDQSVLGRALTALSQGKFLALLSLIFGVGLSLQYRSARRKAIRWPSRYGLRMLLLFIDGVLNYLLIAEFDVLIGYAVTGFVVSYLLLTRPKTQTRLIIIFGTLHLVLISLLAWSIAAFPVAGPTTVHSPYAQGSFFELIAFRIDNFSLFRAEPILIFALSISMFLLGARLANAGVFAPTNTKLRRTLIIIGVIAAPIDFGLGVSGNTAAIFVERYAIAPFVSLGLLAVIIEASLAFGTTNLPARLLQSVGRTALSCYLLQNLLGSWLFYGWGLGLVNQIQHYQVAATMVGYFVIAALVTITAHLWLRWFPIGPVEWVWKKLANLKMR